jgi:hypothetical protein
MPLIDLPTIESHCQQLDALQPQLEEFLTEPLTEQTRRALDLTLALSGFGLALQFGLIELSKLSAAGVEVKLIGKSTVYVLALLSSFFLVRFMLDYKKDDARFKLSRGRAALAMQAFFYPVEEMIRRAEGGAVDQDFGAYEFAQEVVVKKIDQIKTIDRYRKIIDLVFPICLWALLIAAIAWQFASGRSA